MGVAPVCHWWWCACGHGVCMLVYSRHIHATSMHICTYTLITQSSLTCCGQLPPLHLCYTNASACTLITQSPHTHTLCSTHTCYVQLPPQQQPPVHPPWQPQPPAQGQLRTTPHPTAAQTVCVCVMSVGGGGERRGGGKEASGWQDVRSVLKTRGGGGEACRGEKAESCLSLKHRTSCGQLLIQQLRKL